MKQKLQLPVASWYRDLSNYQINGARGLQAALAYDIELGSTRSVRHCLQQIGVSPIVGCKQLKRIMKLSRGNDMAFLYFLMAAYYKTPHSEGERLYSINEQQIMSSIAKLDMALTLESLDRILPPGVSTNKPTKKVKPPITLKPHSASLNKNPYFQKQPKPKWQSAPGKFISAPPPYTVHFEEDEQQGDIASEANRWFADYNLQPNRRLVDLLISEEIDAFFDKINEFQKLSCKEVLCSYHRASRDLERDNYIVESRKRCLKFIDVTEKHKKLTRQRITKQLNELVERYLQEFGEKWSCHWSLLPTQPLEECRVCSQLMSKSIRTPTNVLLLEGAGQVLCRPTAITTPVEATIKRDEFPCLQSDQSDQLAVLCLDGARDTQDNCMITPSNVALPKLNKRLPSPLCERNNNTNQSAAKPSQLDKLTRTLGHTNDTFFKSCSTDKPFALDYQQVFNVRITPLSTEETIRIAAVHALGERNESTVDTCIPQRSAHLGPDVYEFEPRDFPGGLQFQQSHILSDAVSKCANNIMKMSLRNSEKKEISTDYSYIYDMNKPLNPNDDELMDEMLENAFKLLRKDHKFVLATFPQGHQLPVLREWIKRRYGKQYKTEPLSQTKQTMARLQRMINTLSLPKTMPKFDGHDTIQSYAKIEHFTKLAQETCNEYKRNIQDKVLERYRIFSHEQHHHLDYSNTMRDAFYCYAPNRVLDMQPTFGVWSAKP